MATKTPARKPVDWERIETLFRAGILSVREIASECGVSHTAINKRARTHDWQQDLKAKIQARAEQLVSTAAVSKEVSTKRVETDKAVIETNAQAIMNIRLGHRHDIARARRLLNRLLDDLEDLTYEQGDLKGMIQDLRDGIDDDDKAMADVLTLANRIGSLPSRSKVMKEICETLKTVVALERDAYDILSANKNDPPPPGDIPARLTLADFYAPKK